MSQLHDAGRLGLAVIFIQAVQCHAGGPAPTPGPPPDTGDASFVTILDEEAITAFGELVEAGCAPYDDAGAMELEEAHSSTDSPDWLNCLFDSGTIASCNVPCGQSSALKVIRRR